MSSYETPVHLRNPVDGDLIYWRDSTQRMENYPGGGGGGGDPSPPIDPPISGPLAASFVTVNPETSLPNSRILDANRGFTIEDGGPQQPVIVQPPDPIQTGNLMTVDGSGNWVSTSPIGIPTGDAMAFTLYESRDWFIINTIDGVRSEPIHYELSPLFSNVVGAYPRLNGSWAPLHGLDHSLGSGDGIYFDFSGDDEQFWLCAIQVPYHCEGITDLGAIRLNAVLYENMVYAGSLTNGFATGVPLSATLLANTGNNSGNTVNYTFPIHLPAGHSNRAIKFSIDQVDGDIGVNLFVLMSAYLMGIGGSHEGTMEVFNPMRADSRVCFYQLRQTAQGDAINQASYVVLHPHAQLTDERVLQGSLGFNVTDQGAGTTVTIEPPPVGGSGNFMRSDGSEWVSQTVNNGVSSGLLPTCTTGQHLVASGTNTWAATTLPGNGQVGGFLPSAGSNTQVLTSNGTSWSAADLPAAAAYTGTTNKITVAGTVVSQPDVVHVGSTDNYVTHASNDALLIVGSGIVHNGTGTGKTESVIIGANSFVSNALSNSLMLNSTGSVPVSNSMMVNTGITISGSITNCALLATSNGAVDGTIADIAVMGYQPRVDSVSGSTLITGGTAAMNSGSPYYNGSFPGHTTLTNTTPEGVHIVGRPNVTIGSSQGGTGKTEFIGDCPQTAIAPTIGDHLVNKTYADGILPAPGSSGNVLKSNGTTWSSQPFPRRVLFRIFAPNTGSPVNVSGGYQFNWAGTSIRLPDASVISIVTPNTHFRINSAYEGFWRFSVRLHFVNTAISQLHTCSFTLRNGTTVLASSAGHLHGNESDRMIAVDWIGSFTASELSTSSFNVHTTGSGSGIVSVQDTNERSWFFAEYMSLV